MVGESQETQSRNPRGQEGGSKSTLRVRVAGRRKPRGEEGVLLVLLWTFFSGAAAHAGATRWPPARWPLNPSAHCWVRSQSAHGFARNRQ